MNLKGGFTLKSNKGCQLSRENLVDLYSTMIKVRLFEEAAIAHFRQGDVLGNMHMSIGQEATATGIMKALKLEDLVASNHRCDGHLIAKGADIRKMMAELMGKNEGYCRGRAGKMHLSAPEVGVLSANGIVGASLPLATGHALYASIYKTDQVAVAMFGDGAANEGAFHESLNLAALWNLPVVFVCENNQFAISTRFEEATASETVAQRGAAYNIPGVRVDGNDVIAVYKAAKEAVDRARSGKGPTLIECFTYRIRGHHEGDEQNYRSREETEEWRINKCPIKRLNELLTSDFNWNEKEDQAIIQSLEQEIAQAVEFGLKGIPSPVKDMEKFLYAPEVEQL
jgi:TPP-dependent pyruvate/acetoin dehydrogenase alpha subunit